MSQEGHAGAILAQACPDSVLVNWSWSERESSFEIGTGYARSGKHSFERDGKGAISGLIGRES